MKQELLEQLIRMCVCEILDNVNEADTKGAPSPPAGGLGTADQPAAPPKKSSPPPESEPKPEEKPEETPEETPEPTPQQNVKGLLLINPLNKASLSKIPLASNTNDIIIDKTLKQYAKKVIGNASGNSIIVPKATIALIKSVISNPNTALYLYLMKYDPSSLEVYVKGDKSLQVAKDASLKSTDIMGVSTEPTTPVQLPQNGQPQQQLAEEHRKLIKKLVTQILNKK